MKGNKNIMFNFVMVSALMLTTTFSGITTDHATQGNVVLPLGEQVSASAGTF